MGVKIAIDDFGTGFSSLSQLQQLPIDEIKIDKSFVTRMEVNRNDAVLVRSIIELARNLGLRVTAEGVETESIRASLRKLGCDYAQGFHIGRPAPALECRASLGEPRRVALAAV
jgi:EAL domain-containing protein (putative c-di-GMP-specific phosphodiesterase class I)